MKTKGQPHTVWNEVIIYLLFKKKIKKPQYYRLAWLCAKRCFGSEGGHTASTNINASAAFSWQKKEPTKSVTSKLIKAALFLEREICVSTDTASHIAPTQGNTLRWIKFLFILLGDPQKLKDEAKACSQHKSFGETPSNTRSSGLSTDETAHLKRPHTGQKHPAPVGSCELQASHTLQSPWHWGSGNSTGTCKPFQGTTRC